MVVRPINTSMELWCDADFCGDWDPDMANLEQQKSQELAT